MSWRTSRHWLTYLEGLLVVKWWTSLIAECNVRIITKRIHPNPLDHADSVILFKLVENISWMILKRFAVLEKPSHHILSRHHLKRPFGTIYIFLQNLSSLIDLIASSYREPRASRRPHPVLPRDPRRTLRHLTRRRPWQSRPTCRRRDSRRRKERPTTRSSRRSLRRRVTGD